MHRTHALLTSTALALLVAGCAAPKTTVRVSPPTTHAAPAKVTSHVKACPTEQQQQQWLQRPLPTSSGTPMNTPQAEALTEALDPKSHKEFADIYGTLIVDLPVGRVALCVTDLAGGRLMAQAAKKRDPRIDLTRLDLYTCRYSQQALDRVVDRMSRAGTTVAGFPIYNWSPIQDYSGIEVGSTQAGADSKAMHAALAAIAGDIPVVVVKGEPAQVQ